MPSKLITLPADNAVQAQQILTQALHDNKVLIIVIGDTQIAKDTAVRVDRSTGAPDEPRWAVRAPVLNDVLTIFQSMKDPKQLVKDWTDTLFIAVSITDVICDMVDRDGTLPTLPRLQIAWMRAEANL